MTLVNPFEKLLEISEEINATRETSKLLNRIMDTALGVLSAERGFIMLKSHIDDEDYQIVTARNLSQDAIDSIREHSSSVVHQVLQTQKSLISVDAQADERFQGAESILIQDIHSVICTPLIYKNHLMGAIYMDRRMSKKNFTDDALDFLRAFSAQAAVAIENARLFDDLQEENKALREQLNMLDQFSEIIGRSKPIKKVFETVRSVAASTATVLLEGESGTGKELVARAIHNNSNRNEKAFIPIFCGSLSENLLESELFGHKKGAFTGANENKIGLFEEADGGTVFLDEISEVGLNVQTKLLRVIQEGEIKRVGDSQLKKVDVRIISATNKELRKEVKDGRFREDLFYRLNVINIKIPPLRERQQDILLLAEHFLKHFIYKNRKSFKGFTADAKKYLLEYDWPGNVRELENAIERAVILCHEPEIPPEAFQLQNTDPKMPLGKTLKEINKYAIIKTIEMTNGNRTRAAEILDVSRRWLQYQLKEWGMIDEN